jgi:hypothetical protein
MVYTRDILKKSYVKDVTEEEKIKIYEGYIRDGEEQWLVAEAEISLVEEEEYVYVYQNKSDRAVVGIATLSTMPADTSAEYRWPIIKLIKSAVEGDYLWTVDKVFHTGDVLRGGLTGQSFPFKMTAFLDDETWMVEVLGGKWTRNAIVTTLNDTDLDGFAASTIYYIYLERIMIKIYLLYLLQKKI